MNDNSAEQILFTIIIPCYNVELYLDDCMESVVGQTYPNFEVLLIDDGSKDSTFDKCKNWAAKDIRVHTYTKRNGGLSDARNYGIERSQGDYIVFVDSDDYIEPDSLLKISKCIRDNTEVIITRMIGAYPDKNVIKDRDMKIQITEFPCRREALKWILQESSDSWPAPKYIVSKKFVENYQLRFRVGYLHEDLDWTSKVCCLANEYSVCYFPWYYHRLERPGSITNVVNVKRILDVIEMVYDFTDGTNKKQLDNLELDEAKMLINRLMESAYAILSFYKRVSQEDKEKVCVSLREHYKMLRYAHKLKYKLFVFAVRMLGFKNALNILALVS